MNQESKLEVKSKTGTKGKVFNNIDLRDIKTGDYVIVEKTKFIMGLKKNGSKDGKSYDFYICTVIYNGQEVTMILNEKAHTDFANTGGIGDKLKITKTVEEYKPNKFKAVYTFVRA